MEQPRFQYARAPDGVSIAFRIYGDGDGQPILGVATGPWGIAMEAENAGYRRWYERLASKRMVILSDMRGTGLSGGAAEWSIDSQVRDLDALLNHLKLDSVALVSPPFGGPVAIAYAARHPERVSHLILWCSWARTRDVMGSPQGAAILALIDQDWEVFTESLTYMLFGWESGAEAHDLAVAFRAHIKPELLRAFVTEFMDFDVTDLLAQVKAPTLVLQARAATLPTLDVAQTMASRIPNSRLSLMEGNAIPWSGDMETNARTFDEFLGDSPDPISSTPATLHSGTAIILFADIVDSTRLTEQLGDTAFRERARKLDETMRRAITQANGSTIEGKLLGDGVLAIFTAARDAITAAIACRDASRDVGLELHLGLHAGDVIREQNNVYGGAVNIAARISGLSAPGELLVSRTVADLAHTSAGVSFVDRGEHALKGVAEPQRVFAVQNGG